MPGRGKRSASEQLLRLFRLIKLFSRKNGMTIEDVLESDIYADVGFNEDRDTARENARTQFKRDREALSRLYYDLRTYYPRPFYDDEYDEDAFAEWDEDDSGSIPKAFERRMESRGNEKRWVYYLKDELLLIPMNLRQEDAELIEASLQLGSYFLPMYRENAGRVRRQLTPYLKADKSKKKGEKLDKDRDKLKSSIAVKIPVAKINEKIFKNVLNALLEERVLDIAQYRSYQGAVIRGIEFSPWCVYFRFHTWYAYGYTTSSQTPGPGTYRIDQILACSVDTGGKKQYCPAPEDFTPGEISFEFSEARYPLKLFIYPSYAKAAAAAVWFPGEKKCFVENPEDGNQKNRLDYGVTVGEFGLEEVANWIAGAMDCFEIRDSEGAEALRARLREKLEKLKRRNPML